MSEGFFLRMDLGGDEIDPYQVEYWYYEGQIPAELQDKAAANSYGNAPDCNTPVLNGNSFNGEEYALLSKNKYHAQFRIEANGLVTTVAKTGELNESGYPQFAPVGSIAGIPEMALLNMHQHIEENGTTADDACKVFVDRGSINTTGQSFAANFDVPKMNG